MQIFIYSIVIMKPITSRILATTYTVFNNTIKLN